MLETMTIIVLMDQELDEAYMSQPVWRHFRDVKGVPAHLLRAQWWFRNFVLEAYYQTHDLSANAILWPPCLHGVYVDKGYQYPVCWCCLVRHDGVVPPVMTIVRTYADLHDYAVPEGAFNLLRTSISA